MRTLQEVSQQFESGNPDLPKLSCRLPRSPKDCDSEETASGDVQSSPSQFVEVIEYKRLLTSLPPGSFPFPPAVCAPVTDSAEIAFRYVKVIAKVQGVHLDFRKRGTHATAEPSTTIRRTNRQ